MDVLESIAAIEADLTMLVASVAESDEPAIEAAAALGVKAEEIEQLRAAWPHQIWPQRLRRSLSLKASQTVTETTRMMARLLPLITAPAQTGPVIRPG